jgi:alkanesulfonate monooxygenase SsuD/methylene tetrahydromethanopterin reductase-like flavin-dependent oxidoreductase (luciferase family)
MKIGTLHLFENPKVRTEHECVREQLNMMCAAEDLAMLDLMSDGRVIAGLGRGYQPGEFKGFRIDQETSRELFDEQIRLLAQCWNEDRVNFDGKFYQVEDLVVRPKPLQQPHLPIYMAVLSPETWEIAGRYGFNVLTSCAFGMSEEDAVSGMARYRKARAEAGLNPEQGSVAMLFQVYAAPTMEEALGEYGPAVTWYYRTIAKYVAPKGAAVKSYEGYKDAQKLAQTVEFEQLLDTAGMVVGTPEVVTEKVTRLANGIAFDELLCWVRIGGMPEDKVVRAMDLIASKVMPEVRKNLANRGEHEAAVVSAVG